MPDDKSKEQGIIEDLRQQYLANLREYRPEFAEFLCRIEQGNVTQKERDLVYLRARTLSETGKTYGFESLADAARPLAQAFQLNGSPAVLALCLRALLDACQFALTFASGHHVVPRALEEHAFTADRPRLLVADDDRMILHTMQSLFAAKLQVIVTDNGKDAHALIVRHRPDLVILDDVMPGMSGLALLETLRRDPSLCDTRVMMLTGSNRPQDIARGVSAGVIDYILKPFDLNEMVEKVRRITAA